MTEEVLQLHKKCVDQEHSLEAMNGGEEQSSSIDDAYEEYATTLHSREYDDKQMTTTTPNYEGVDRNNDEKENGSSDRENLDHNGQNEALEHLKQMKIVRTQIYRRNTPHQVQKKIMVR